MPFAKLSVLDSGCFSDLRFCRCNAPACSLPGWHPQPGWRKMRGTGPGYPTKRVALVQQRILGGTDEGSGDAWS